MSCCDRRAGLAALAGALLLPACGFRPVYGDAAAPDGLLAAGVAVGQTPGRDGFAYDARLRRRLSRDAAPLYRVDSALALDVEGLAISQDDETTRFNVIGDARYTVTRLSDGATVGSGTVRSIAGYSATGSPFATRAARRDAERRVAEDLAEKVFGRLAALTLAPGDPAA